MKQMENIKRGLRKADRVLRSFKDKNSASDKRVIHVSRPVQQSTTATSALLPESVQQLNECYKRCSASTVFLKRLIETQRYELVSEAVTDIFKQTAAMMESINRRECEELMGQRQQLARTYLATLVKLSDRLNATSTSDEIEHAAKMVDQLVDTLGDIAKRAQDLMPHIIEHGLKEQLSLDETDAVPRSILRNRIHNSMEDLANGVGGDGLGSGWCLFSQSFFTIIVKIDTLFFFFRVLFHIVPFSQSVFLMF